MSPVWYDPSAKMSNRFPVVFPQNTVACDVPLACGKVFEINDTQAIVQPTLEVVNGRSMELALWVKNQNIKRKTNFGYGLAFSGSISMLPPREKVDSLSGYMSNLKAKACERIGLKLVCNSTAPYTIRVDNVRQLLDEMITLKPGVNAMCDTMENLPQFSSMYMSYDELTSVDPVELPITIPKSFNRIVGGNVVLILVGLINSLQGLEEDGLYDSVLGVVFLYKNKCYKVVHHEQVLEFPLLYTLGYLSMLMVKTGFKDLLQRQNVSNVVGKEVCYTSNYLNGFYKVPNSNTVYMQNGIGSEFYLISDPTALINFPRTICNPTVQVSPFPTGDIPMAADDESFTLLLDDDAPKQPDEPKKRKRKTKTT